MNACGYETLLDSRKSAKRETHGGANTQKSMATKLSKLLTSDGCGVMRLNAPLTSLLETPCGMAYYSRVFAKYAEAIGSTPITMTICSR